MGLDQKITLFLLCELLGRKKLSSTKDNQIRRLGIWEKLYKLLTISNKINLSLLFRQQNHYQNHCQQQVCTMKFTDKAT